MQRDFGWKWIHWKVKKYIIEAVCALVLVCVMGISLLGQSSSRKQDELVYDENLVQEKNIEQTADSTNLYLNTSVVEEMNNTEENRLETSEKHVGDTEKQSEVNHEEQSETNREQVIKEVADSDLQSDAKDTSSDVKRNNVVKTPVKESVSQVNRIAKNAEPLSLVEHVFENYGTAPEMGESVCRYQFPVEIGYPVNSNYEGLGQSEDYIVNKVYDVETDSSDKEMVSEDNTEEEIAETESTEQGEKIECETYETETDSVSGVNSENEENADITEEQVSDSGEEVEIAKKEINAGYYIIKGRMREGSEVFVSDIEIIPAKVDGFDKVRIGTEGDFVSSLLITEDAVDKSIELCFTDGEQITEPVIFTYSKDTIAPDLQVKEGIKTVESEDRVIYCTNDNNIYLDIRDGSESAGNTIEQIRFLYSDKLKYVVDYFEEPKITLEEDFYGRIVMNCKDKAGNVSDIQSQYILVEQNAPEITMTVDERCTAPYTLWVTVTEVGDIVSGIQSIQCVVNGENYEVKEATVSETVKLDNELDVSSKIVFPIEIQEVGSYTVDIQVVDYAGNETMVGETLEVTEPEMVSVYMPKNFTIHIDPQQLAGREQIFSDDITLDNVSEFDVCVKIDEIILNVKDEVSDTGVKKDCDVYLVAPDTGERIELSKGKNENVYTYCLPQGNKADIDNLYFIGNTTEGSDRMWKGSDISIQVKLSFEKWEE